MLHISSMYQGGPRLGPNACYNIAQVIKVDHEVGPVHVTT